MNIPLDHRCTGVRNWKPHLSAEGNPHSAIMPETNSPPPVPRQDFSRVGYALAHAGANKRIEPVFLVSWWGFEDFPGEATGECFSIGETEVAEFRRSGLLGF